MERYNTDKLSESALRYISFGVRKRNIIGMRRQRNNRNEYALFWRSMTTGEVIVSIVPAAGNPCDSSCIFGDLDYFAGSLVNVYERWPSDADYRRLRRMQKFLHCWVAHWEAVLSDKTPQAIESVKIV